jgi:hypothetical protein
MEFGMKKKIALVTPVALSIVAASVFTFSGCGNGWFDSKDRRETPAALMFDAQKAYDNDEYSKAASLYKKAVAKDPNNVQARVGWAFAVNGEAGMSLTQVMHDIIASEQESAVSANLADSSSTTKAFAILKSLGVDFSDEDNSRFLDELQKYWKAASTNSTACATDATACEIELIKKHSKKVKKLIKSFQIVCPLMDPDVLQFIQDDLTAKRVLLDNKEYKKICNGGMKGGSGAAAFAATIALLGQAAVEWTLLDHKTYNSTSKEFTSTTTGDGQPDLVGELNVAFEKISKAKTDMTAGTTGLTDTLKAFNDNTTALTTGLARTELDSFKMLVKNVKVITRLIESSLNLGESTSQKFTDVESKIDEATEKISQYKKPTSTSGTTTGTSGSPTESTTKAATASKDIEAAIAKKIGEGGSLDTTQQAQLDQICTNFTTLKNQAGLPDSSQPPCNCPTVTDKDSCCASKSDALSTPTSERFKCCSSAYGTATPPNSCLTKAKATSLALNLAAPANNTTTTLSLATPESSENEQLLSLLELFQAADRTWRDER